MNLFEYLGFKKAYENSHTPAQGKSMALYGYNVRHGYLDHSTNESSKSTEKSTKTASTKESSKSKDDSSSSNITVNVNTPSTSLSTSSGNMDWMTEDYSNGSTNTLLNDELEEPFNALKEVWNSDLGKIPIRVASRYLEDKLLKLVDLYNMKVAETIGQKRG